jgi:hypothetical protein
VAEVSATGQTATDEMAGPGCEADVNVEFADVEIAPCAVAEVTA